MPWSVRALTARDVADVAAVFRASRRTAMPWLPVLHTPEEDLAFFAGEIASSAGLAAVDDERLVGFALSRDGWLNHLYLDPEWRGRGVGSALLREVVRAMPGTVQLWAFERNEAALRFYEAHGFEVVERTDGSANEEREPDVRLRCRPKVSVRAAVPSDADTIARVHVRSWQSAYAGLVDADHLARLDPVERADRWRERLEEAAPGVTVDVAVSGDRVVGFVSAGPPRDADLQRQQERWVEVYACYVDPGRWRQGVATALWRVVEGRWGPEVAGVALWVLRDNIRARDFYAALGLTPDGAERSIAIGGQDLAEIRLARWQ